MDKSLIMSEATALFNKGGFSLADGEKLIQQSSIPVEAFRAGFGSLSALIAAIFQELCRESDCISEGLDDSGTSLKRLLKMTLESYKVQTKYRFIFLHLHVIIEQIEPVRDRYCELISLRKTQLIHLFRVLESERLLRGEIITGQYDNLANQMIILSDFWLSHNYMVFGKDSYRPEYYSKLVLSILVPYLTESGLAEYHDAIK